MTDLVPPAVPFVWFSSKLGPKNHARILWFLANRMRVFLLFSEGFRIRLHRGAGRPHPHQRPRGHEQAQNICSGE